MMRKTCWKIIKGIVINAQFNWAKGEFNKRILELLLDFQLCQRYSYKHYKIIEIMLEITQYEVAFDLNLTLSWMI